MKHQLHDCSSLPEDEQAVRRTKYSAVHHKRAKVYFDPWFQRIRVHDHHGEEQVGTKAGMAQRTRILRHNHEEERATLNDFSLMKLQLSPLLTYLSYKVQLPNPLQQVY